MTQSSAPPMNMPRKGILLLLGVLLMGFHTLGATPALAVEDLILPRESTWKYEATGTDLGTAWKDTAYADGGWPSDPAILGYGETYIDTAIPFGPDPNNKYVTSYFRTTFTLADASIYTRLTLLANYDDGFVIYLNGVEAARRSMPGGAVTYATLASELHEGGEYEHIDLGGSLPHLVDGLNHVAVEVHQRDLDSSDLVMDMELRAADDEYALLPRQSTWRYEATGTNLGTGWRDTTYADGAWPSDPAILGYGESYIDTDIPYGPDANNKYITSYFRTTFTNAALSSYTKLLLLANYDDGFVLYLNGVEAVRRSMPGGAISYSTLAAALHEGGAYELIDLSGSLGNLVTGTNHVAVEVHQRNLSSSDLVMDMELFASDSPVYLTRGPYLQLATPTSIRVRWRTDVPTASRVNYGDAPGNLTQVVSSGTLTTEHELELTPLAPDTEYFYSIGDGVLVLAGGDANHRFRTYPTAGTVKPFRVWVLGDCGTGDSNAAAVRDGFADWAGNVTPDVWLMLGDNAYNTGTDGEYQAGVFDMYTNTLRASALWSTRGNHDDTRSGDNNDYYEFFTLPTAGESGGVVSGTEAYYSFDVGNTHFICLDSDGTDLSPSSVMWTWLSSDLAATSAEWIVAFWHHPPYSKGSHDSDIPGESGGRLEEMRAEALPILEAGGVDLVLCGHSHSYERSYLIDGHYGVSSTFNPGTMLLDGTSGNAATTGPYVKPGGGPTSHAGTVYAVAGSSGKTGGGTFNHPVMHISVPTLGSLVLDINDDQLEASFIGTNAGVIDQFTIYKGEATGVPDAPVAVSPMLAPAHPNPMTTTARLAFSLPERGAVRLRLVDVQGARVRDLVDREMGAGEHVVVWDGRDAAGRETAAGAYFAVLEVAGERRVRKIVRVE